MSVVAVPVVNRRRNPKVRTGCFTCKIRRVKCDEAKPDCSRCTSTGRKCDGYAKPKDAFQVQVFAPSQPIIRLQPSMSLLAELGSSLTYLEFYHQCAAPSLSSRFDHEFWSKTSLQMAYAEPAVRHAVIALGYLNKTESGSLKHARSHFQVAYGSKFFLHHYNQAVRKLVARMAEPSYSPEIGLVTCLLFVCMEFLRGNYCTAFTHLTNGLSLVREWQQQQQQQQQRRDGSVLRDVTGAKGSERLIENVLLPMFQRGMTSAQLYGVATENHLDIPFPSPDRFMQLPFSLHEAERSSRELRNASILFLRQMGTKAPQRIALDEQDLEQQARLAECHRIWFERVQMAEDSQEWSADELVSLSALKVALYALSSYIGCAASVLQVPYDGYLESFRSLIHHARIVLGAMEVKNTHAAKFTFEMSIIPPLYHTATRCRCPATRREAVALLARHPPREGLWDAEQHVLVTKRVIEMEESELDPDTGWPAERTRLYSSVIDANMDANGHFWVYFVPSGWVGETDATGKQKQIMERFSL
ncbi:C6 zinc finger domain protein [Stagonosporopsis vannaccii]|nr:C6 zinc finger domain protein [Stagonosporopsis vannaccii]